MTPICLAFLLWLQLGPLPSVLKPPAQESKPAAEEAKPKGPQPIAVGEIPDRLREAATIVRSASGHATPLPSIQQIERELPRLSKELEELSVTSRDVLKSNPTRSLVNELSSAWSVNRKTLDEWQDTLKGRSSSLQQDLTNLKREAEQWNVTRQDAEDQQLPPEVVTRIDQMLKEFGAAETAVLERRNAILDAQNRISSLRVEVDRATEAIALVLGAQRGEVWRFDSPPIWELFRKSNLQLRELSHKSEAPAQPGEVVKFYVGTVLTGLVVQLFTFVIILGGLLVLRRKGIHTLDDEVAQVQAAVAVLKRPISTALLLSILLGAFIQGETPQVLVELGGLLLLFPLLRVIPRILSSEVKPALWLLAALYVADNTVSLLAKYPLATRLVILAMIASTLGGLFWLDGRLRTRLIAGGWKKVSLFFIRLAMALLAVAFVCELTGATLLGEFVLTGTLKTIYEAILLYGAMRILQGFVLIGLRQRPRQSLLVTKARLSGLATPFVSGLQYVAFIVFLMLAADSFHIDEAASKAIRELFARQLSIGAFQFSLGAVFTFALVLASALVVSRVIRFVLSATVYQKIALQRGSAESLSKIIHYLIVLAGFLLALGAAGIDMSKFTVLAGALGLGIGFGMQNIVNNFVSGLILLFERPIHVGDNITVGTTSGQVADIGIRASTIRTWDGADVIMPNGTLISNEMTNWTLSDVIRRCELRVGVAYGTDPDRVIALLRETVSAHPHVLKDPASTVHFIRFGESSLDFLARFWAAVDRHVDVTSDIHAAVYRRLTEEGIEIPFPQRDLNLKNVGDATLETLITRKPEDNGPR